MISVGQEYHEGSKLAAVVDWLNRNPSIEEVHISVNDYLQRHNYYAQGIPEKQANAIALSEGTLWIERNEEILAGIKARATITRWNDWYGTQQYNDTRVALDEYAFVSPAFESAIEADAARIATRKANRGETVPESLLSHSVDYLREELAVFAMQAAKLPSAEVYPGSNLGSAEYLLGRDLPPSLASLARRYFTRVDFARIELPLEQHGSVREQFSSADTAQRQKFETVEAACKKSPIMMPLMLLHRLAS